MEEEVHKWWYTRVTGKSISNCFIWSFLGMGCGPTLSAKSDETPLILKDFSSYCKFDYQNDLQA
jgi:hypothetical protein